VLKNGGRNGGKDGRTVLLTHVSVTPYKRKVRMDRPDRVKDQLRVEILLYLELEPNWPTGGSVWYQIDESAWTGGTG
jgi:hypothetical protein